MHSAPHALKNWLRQTWGDDDFALQALPGDAGFRRYFRITREGCRLLAAHMPPDKENPAAFVAVTAMLEAAHIAVPHIRAYAPADGFLLIDDFGDNLLGTQLNDDTADGLYRQAIDMLVAIQSVAAQQLPPYDKRALIQEAELFTDWYCIKHLQADLRESDLRQLSEAYHYLADTALEQPRVFVHRDYHSRNLICADAQRMATIDYQDAVAGPLSYDLVSLLKDCYVKWPRQTYLGWVTYYLQRAETDMDADTFIRYFDLMGAQRHLKAAGIFARLHHRDNKDGYLKDIPRTLSYIGELDSGDDPILRNLQRLLNSLPKR